MIGECKKRRRSLVASSKVLYLGAACLCVFFFVSEGIVAQMILGDRRARDTGVTPSLGRGFSLATNTYQSTCLSEVQITEPSFDFSYELIEVNKSSLDTASSSSTSTVKNMWGDLISSSPPGGDQNSSESQQMKQFLEVNLKVNTYYSAVDEALTPLSRAASSLLKREDVPSFFSACGTYYVRGINRHAEFNALLEFEQTSSTSKEDVREAVNNLIFSAVDLPASESNPTCRLTVAEYGLPENKNAAHGAWDGKIGVFEPGTYSASDVLARLGCDYCISQLKLEGPKGCKVVLFNASEPFETARMKKSGSTWPYEIDSPGVYLVWPYYQGLPTTIRDNSIRSFIVKSPPVSKATEARTSKETVKQTNMKIYARGEGLGFSGDSQLVSFTIPEFRNAMKAAFSSMQRVSTGRVTSVEIVPWTENVGFQALLKIQDDSASGDEKKMPLFRKKDILISNGEYLATLHRSLQYRKARYFLARSCQADIASQDWPEWGILKNHVSAGPGRTVGAMRSILDSQNIESILRKQGYFDFLELYEKCVEKILSGNEGAVKQLEESDRIAASEARKEEKATGVSNELRRMERGKALYLFRYNEYPECEQIELAMPVFPGYDSIIANCAPELWGHPSELDSSDLENTEYKDAYQRQMQLRKPRAGTK